MNYIYLVNEETSYDNEFKNCANIKAFKNKERANEFADWLTNYNLRNKVEGIIRTVFIKEIDLEE